MQKKIFFIFLLAFLLRLISINQSLWLDEAITANAVRDYSPIQIITTFAPTDFHPPFYYLFMQTWVKIAGNSELALRFPSIIFSLLTGWVIYQMAGMWSAIFFLFNPLIIYYSQEARMYMLITFLVTATLYYFLRLNRRKDIPSIILFNLFTFLTITTFYGSVLFILFLYGYLILTKRINTLIYLTPGFLSALIILSPLLYQQVLHAQSATLAITGWTSALGKASLKNLLLIPLKFSFGRISFYPKAIYYAIAGGWSLLTFCFMLRGGLQQRLLLFLFSLPIFLGYLLSLFAPLLSYFRFLYLLPIMSMLLAVGASTARLKILLSNGYLLLSLIYLVNPLFHREDWKSLANSLSTNQPVYIILPSSDPLRYYRNDLSLLDLRSLSENKQLAKELTVIPYTAEIYAYNYTQELAKQGYVRTETSSFRSLTVEKWLKAE